MRNKRWLPLLLVPLLIGASYDYYRDIGGGFIVSSGITSTGNNSSFAVNKFGFDADVDDGEMAIWEGANLPTEDDGPLRCPDDVAAISVIISSTDAGDTEVIRVEGLDNNWDRKTVDVTLAGLTFTPVSTASSWMRINRAYNTGSTDLAGTVYLHTDITDGDANGVPDLPSTQTKAVINAAENQTLQACYTVPDGYKAYVTGIEVSVDSTGASNAVAFRLRVTNEDGVGRVQWKRTVQDNDSKSSAFNPPLVYGARTLLELTAITASATASAQVTGSFNMALIKVQSE